jgi:hypothetical protein
MQRVTLLVTSDGQWVLPTGPEFLDALGDANPDYDAVGYAVRNLGFVKFEVLEHSMIEIELHPKNVGFAALLSVQQEIMKSDVRLFRIKFLEGDWRSEISSSAEQVITRLSELCSPAFTPPATERFELHPQDISVLYDDPDNILRPLAQKWKISFAQFDPNVISLAVSHRLLPRLMIAGIKPNQDEPIWRFIGNEHRWIGATYQVHGLGEKVENMPDKDYGAWAKEFYKSVAASREPRYDIVSGSIQFEDESGRPRRWYRYERLMLPWTTPSGEVLVTMCSRPMGTSDQSKSSDSSTPPRSMKPAMS